jgi:hypothetical protein
MDTILIADHGLELNLDINPSLEWSGVLEQTRGLTDGTARIWVPFEVFSDDSYSRMQDHYRIQNRYSVAGPFHSLERIRDGPNISDVHYAMTKEGGDSDTRQWNVYIDSS